MKTTLRKAIQDQGGAALVLTLVLLMIGGLIMAPLFGHIGTGHIAGEVHERRMDEFYAADAGVEQAFWMIRSDDPELPHDPCRDEPWTYNFTMPDVNGKSVHVTIDYLTLEGYVITAVATTDGDTSTEIESYVEMEVFDLFAGALVSSGEIHFAGKDCNVTGDVYYVTDIKGDYTHLDGDETQVAQELFPTPERTMELAQQFKDEALSGGTHIGDKTVTSSGTLGPLYITGDLDFDQSNITVELTGTIYVEGMIRARKEYTFTGSGSIVAVGNIELSKLADYGIEGDTVIMSLEGDIIFKKGGTAEAFVYAPNGQVSIDKDTTIVGTVMAGQISIDKEVSFNYVAKASSFGFLFWVWVDGEVKTYIIS